jgi:hypothetical protein
VVHQPKVGRQVGTPNMSGNEQSDPHGLNIGTYEEGLTYVGATSSPSSPASGATPAFWWQSTAT